MVLVAVTIGVLLSLETLVLVSSIRSGIFCVACFCRFITTNAGKSLALGLGLFMIGDDFRAAATQRTGPGEFG